MENTPYHKLKDSILKEINNSTDLDVLKEHFKQDVASKRLLSRAKTVSELLVLLEERDCLRKDFVTCLAEIGTVLNRPKVTDLVATYKKLCDSEEVQCSVCNENTELRRPSCMSVSQPSPVYSNDAQPVPSFEPASGAETHAGANSSVEDAINILCTELGESWPVLARELGLKESQIHVIRKQRSLLPAVQAQHALLLWKEQQHENATVSALTNALDSRLCRRKGYGPHLLQRKITYRVSLTTSGTNDSRGR